MRDAEAARLRLPTPPLHGWIGLAVASLALSGYLIAADLRVAGAVVVAAALALWSAFSAYQPHRALPASVVMILIAGTKFRMRDPTASLDGVMDAQVLLELVLFAFVGIGVVTVWFTEAARPRLTAIETVILGYSAIALLSTLWSAEPALTLARSTQLAIVSALAIVAVRFLGPARALVTTCTTIALYALACASLAAIFPWTFATYSDAGRFSWFSTHPVEAGTLAAVGALGLLARVVFAPPGARLWPLSIPPFVAAGLLAIVLIWTNSRGPLLAFVIGFATLTLLRLSWRIRVPLVLVCLSGILFFIASGVDARGWLISAANDDSALSRLLFRGQTADTVLELNGRLALWDDLRPAILAHSVIGYGYQASRSVVLDAAAWAAYAHNALLQSALDLGLLGTVALIAVAVVALVGAARSALSPWLRATVAALIVFLLVNSVSTESFAGAPGFEALVLFVCALCVGSRRSADAIGEWALLDGRNNALHGSSRP